MTPYLTIAAAVEMFQISRNTLYRLNDTAPFLVKFGKSTRVDVSAFLQHHRKPMVG